MGVKFSVVPQEMISAGGVMRTAQQQAQTAVLGFCDAAVAVTGRPEHAGIGASAAHFGDQLAGALSDLARSVQGLATVVDSSAELYITTDSDTAYRFAALADL